MRNARARRVGMVTLFGVLVLSVGLVRLVFMVGSAGAAPPIKEDALTGITQNWDKKLSGTSRFTVLADFGGAAVRDNETGLVWEKEPSITGSVFLTARRYCLNTPIGGRRGWRLASIPELTSLVDPAVTSPPLLPPDHPFIVQSAVYWAATIGGGNESVAWSVNFSNGDAGAYSMQSFEYLSWCVRGPMSADHY